MSGPPASEIASSGSDEPRRWTQQTAFGACGRASVVKRSVAEKHHQQARSGSKKRDRRPTECHDVEDGHPPVRAGRREAAAVGADGDAHDLALVRAEHLHELDPGRHLLPELHHALDARRHQEVRERRGRDEREVVAVHQRLRVPRGRRERREVQLLVREGAPLLLPRGAARRGQRGADPVVG